MNPKTVNLFIAIGLVGLALWMFTGNRAPGSARSSLAERLEGKLVERRGEHVVDASPGSLLGKRIIALYFSAHWCPPCRQFTPQLSSFYDRASGAHPEFELILVSNDRSAAEMQEYMRWGKMNFPAVAFDEVQASGLREYSARGIPYLVVLDASGDEIISKGGKEYLSPGVVLGELQSFLAGS